MKICKEFTKANRLEFIRLVGRIRALCHRTRRDAPRVRVVSIGHGRKVGTIEY